MLKDNGTRGHRGLLRLGIAAALAVAATGAWAGGEAEQAAAGSAAESGYTLPIVEPGSVTLSYAGWEHPIGFGDGPVWQRIQEDTGVTVDWQVVPGNDYPSFIKTRIAAAVDLPDMMSLGWNNAVGSPVDLQAQGATIKLTDLVNRYAPNIKRLMEEFTAVRPYLVAPDGDIYATAARTVPPISNYKNWYVREDWLEQLGLAKPASLDDWKSVLKAFRNQDPNGNGEQDEIPLAPRTLWQLEWFGASGLDLDIYYSYGFSLDAGTVSYDYVSPGYRDYLAFLHEMYEAGALSQEVTMTGQTLNSLRVDDRVGGFWTGIGGVLFGNRVLAEAGIAGRYTWTPLPENAQGVARYVHEPLVIAATVITSQSRNPEVAIKWLDYVWGSPQGYLYSNYGIEGDTYNVNPELDSASPWLKHFAGRPEYSDGIRNNPEGKSVQTVLSDIGAFNHPLYADDDESFAARFSEDPFSYELTQLAAPIAVTPFPRYLSSPEQERRLRALREEVIPTQEEWTFKFITGQESLDRFDDYVATMKRVGVDELVAITQEQHDAYTASTR